MARRVRFTEDLLDELVAEATERWRRFEARRPGYHTYVHADWRGAVAPLRRLAPRCTTLLECGSGLGVVTILASLLGYDAYGIELDPWLFERSLELAEHFDADVLFAQGSFLPAGARDDVRHESAEFLTIRDGTPAYADLGMELRDFDLVYAFPWPGEEDRFVDLVRTHARPDTRLLLYSASDGYRLTE